MDAVTYVGHATTLIDLDGTRLLTDPILRPRIGHIRRIAPPAPATTGDGIAAVLISHAHHDHLDLPSLARFDRALPVVVPRGVGRLLQGRASVIEVAEGDEFSFGDVTVRATHAEHDGHRAGSRARGPALGFAITGSQRIYFAGDTGLFAGMADLAPNLDLALVPLWGWGPTLGRGSHLDPTSAAEALRLLRPRLAVPIHWGTYRPLHRGARAAFLRAPAEAFVREAAAVAPEVEVRVLRPGERLSL
jgi:L-ascorbate metabolism protein UlaG (beta-lactamase superfamily)